MKILVLTNYYPPYYIGGYELACCDTVEFLKRAGHDVYVLTGNYKASSDKFQRVYRKLKYIDYSNPSFKDKNEIEEFNFKTTNEVIAKVKPDLVYVWSLRLVSMSPVWALEKLKVKKIFEIGDFWMKGFLSNSFFSKIKRKVKETLPYFKSTKIKIDPIISVSSWMKDEMKEKYGSKKIFQIPNGTKISQEKFTKDNSTMRYMFCGRIDFTKGLDLAIKALGRLKDAKKGDFEFHIYGEGDETYIRKCKNLVSALHLESNVIFHGKKNNLANEYKKNHVLLMPTRMREPFGLVLIEAMNYGVVSIATNAYGPKEIIEHKKDGFLFKESDLDDLSAQVMNVHKNWTLLEDIRENGYQKVETKFDLNIVKKDVEKVLLDVVKA